MSMNRQGRVSRPEAEGGEGVQTFTGNRALMLEEPLIFEIGDRETTGVDLPRLLPVHGEGDHAQHGGGGAGQATKWVDTPLHPSAAPSGCPPRERGGASLPLRTRPIGLPGLSEPETVRHYTRLSRQNYAIDLGLFPLGSCTMKHNPRLNEKMARLPGFADIHPLAPQETVQGAYAVIHLVADWLCKLTGMPAVAMSPKAGAHGELCGLLAIRSALEARGDARSVVLVPESAHGTNPATAAFAGYAVENIPATPEGRVDFDALVARLGPDVAAVMITNPNTCGLFERDMKRIADAVHAAGGFV
jgi:glycine dehydrogenase subunit 2